MFCLGVIKRSKRNYYLSVNFHHKNYGLGVKLFLDRYLNFIKRLRMLSRTGQISCYNESGQEIACRDSGQDGEYQLGSPWPLPRFVLLNETVRDRLTGLIWSRDANPHGFPVTWPEALASIAALNRDHYLGDKDWRLPNRRELRSLMSYQSKKPALPTGHPFVNIFLGWYWSSTSAAVNPAYAWSVHLEGARLFYGRKDQYSLFWPVRGRGSGLLPCTGQKHCYDSQGRKIPPAGSGQDGESRRGRPWPAARFATGQAVVLDRLTNLCWTRQANHSAGPVSWQQALDLIRRLNEARWAGLAGWRLPNINELESLVDCAAHHPALPAGHPFVALREGYWSSTTSFFETDWAWVLYLDKGAIGVGHKPGRTFFVWPVCTAPEPALPVSSPAAALTEP